MTSQAKTAVVVTLALTGALLVGAIAYVIAMMTIGASVSTQGAVMESYVAPAPGVSETRAYDGNMGEEAKSIATVEDAAPAGDTGAPAESLIVRNSLVEVRVNRVDPAIATLRTAVTAAGGEISDLTVTRGSGDMSPEAQSAGVASGPVYANITIRVPAEKLGQLETQVAKLGTVLSQSSSADDVTEAAIDLRARLKNLRAEEVRLRSFLDKTTKVSELLEVERELARVRGEIESMDAQLTYLERQAARATLTVTLSEPGPLAESTGITWGLREAFARGIAVAASLITGLVMMAVPAALILSIALLIYVIIRLIARRRAHTRSQAANLPGDEGADA